MANQADAGRQHAQNLWLAQVRPELYPIPAVETGDDAGAGLYADRPTGDPPAPVLAAGDGQRRRRSPASGPDEQADLAAGGDVRHVGGPMIISPNPGLLPVFARR